jgi:hypothetical protein
MLDGRSSLQLDVEIQCLPAGSILGPEMHQGWRLRCHLQREVHGQRTARQAIRA